MKSEKNNNFIKFSLKGSSQFCFDIEKLKAIKLLEINKRLNYSCLMSHCILILVKKIQDVKNVKTTV